MFNVSALLLNDALLNVLLQKSSYFQLLLCVKLHSKRRTDKLSVRPSARLDRVWNERTDGRTERLTPGIKFGASVTSGGNNCNEFPDNWPNFVYLLVDPGFYPLPLNFFKLIFLKLKHCGLFSHRMDARDRHNGQRQSDGRTDGRTKRRVASLRPSVRLLENKNTITA